MRTKTIAIMIATMTLVAVRTVTKQQNGNTDNHNDDNDRQHTRDNHIRHMQPGGCYPWGSRMHDPNSQQPPGASDAGPRSDMLLELQEQLMQQHQQLEMVQQLSSRTDQSQPGQAAPEDYRSIQICWTVAGVITARKGQRRCCPDRWMTMVMTTPLTIMIVMMMMMLMMLVMLMLLLMLMIISICR